jgi:hypothetical protein
MRQPTAAVAPFGHGQPAKRGGEPVVHHCNGVGEGYGGGAPTHGLGGWGARALVHSLLVGIWKVAARVTETPRSRVGSAGRRGIGASLGGEGRASAFLKKNKVREESNPGCGLGAERSGVEDCAGWEGTSEEEV